MNAQASDVGSPSAQRLHFSTPAAILVFASALLALVPFTRALSDLYDIWSLQPEYSHGVLIPAISLFLLWRERRWLSETAFTGSWWGPALLAAGLLLWLLGQLSATLTLTHYGFLLVVYGMVLALTGWRVMARLWMPLFVLVFMIPLPPFLTQSLSLKLQLLSSSIGVSLIRLVGISVFVEGNVIDLGVYKLQVAEACDGLRYLFPLMTLGFVVAYFFRGAFWKRALIFFSSIPIAITMNVIRIGVIGITVDRWGIAMAEGFLHEFQGWVVFMASTALLIGVAALLSRVGPGKLGWRDTFLLDSGEPLRDGAGSAIRSVPVPFVGAALLALVAFAGGLLVPERAESIPARANLVEFPQTLGEWRGQSASMELIYLDALHLSDYVLSTYRRSASKLPVNLYVAWYDSQRKGASAHSPRSCLPGGGWQIEAFDTIDVAGLGAGGASLPVNRVQIGLGSNHQIVYYWFEQRGRRLTNEYLVKWYIFWDSLTRNRTDGALVRLTVPLGPDVAIADADRELAEFARLSVPALRRYIPD